MIRCVILSAACCACFCQSLAQDAPLDAERPSLAILAPTIGVSVQQLVNEQTAFVPNRMVGKRRVTRRWILNRKFVEERATTMFAGFPQGESHAIYTNDELQAEFRWWVFDTFGVASEFIGTWDAKNRTITWKTAKKRADGYQHVTVEVVNDDGTLSWEAKGTQADGTLAVHQTGRTQSPPQPKRE